MSDFEKCIGILSLIEKTNLRLQSKAVVLLERLSELAQAYEQLSSDGRREVFGVISKGVGMKLIALGSLSAERAIDTDNIAWIRYGILLHVMEGFRDDYRENFRHLIFLYHASQRLREDFQFICHNTYHLANEETCHRLDEFCSRDPSLNQLKAFGMKAVKVDNRTRFVSA